MLFQYKNIKRILDILFSGLLILVLFPLSLIISLLIFFDSPGPILFRQQRAGLNNKKFDIIKFRTMRVGTPSLSTEQLRASGLKTITRFGYILRYTSLDEIPQILNILAGEMSFVGPRPALISQTDLIDLRRINGVDGILPGLTGLAQVRGRDALGIEDKVRLDAIYVQNFSFVEDFRILFFETPISLIVGRGKN